MRVCVFDFARLSRSRACVRVRVYTPPPPRCRLPGSSPGYAPPDGVIARDVLLWNWQVSWLHSSFPWLQTIP